MATCGWPWRCPRVRTLTSGSLSTVRVPNGAAAERENRNALTVSWPSSAVGAPLLAVDFFNQINMLYGTITEFCTPQECKVMSAGPKYEYHWSDGVQFKKPVRVSAPEYIDYLMTWVSNLLDDEAVFPSRIGAYPRFGDWAAGRAAG